MSSRSLANRGEPIIGAGAVTGAGAGAANATGAGAGAVNATGAGAAATTGVEGAADLPQLPGA